MADKIIASLPSDGNDPNIRLNDWIPISRGGVTYKARIAGQYLVPQATSADAKKFLVVDSNGIGSWQLFSRANARSAPTKTTIWDTGQTLTSSGYDISLDAGYQFSDFDDIAFKISARVTVNGSIYSGDYAISTSSPAFAEGGYHTVTDTIGGAIVAIRHAGASKFNAYYRDTTPSNTESFDIRVDKVLGIIYA